MRKPQNVLVKDFCGHEYRQLRKILGNLSVASLLNADRRDLLNVCPADKRVIMLAFLNNELPKMRSEATRLPAEMLGPESPRYEQPAFNLGLDDQLYDLPPRRAISEPEAVTAPLELTSKAPLPPVSAPLPLAAHPEGLLAPEANLTAHQLFAWTSRTRGNGACLFQALAKHLPPYSASVLRARACDWMLQHADFVLRDGRTFSEAALADAVSDGHTGTLAHYVDIMRGETIYGGAPELVAISQLYEVHIQVYRHADDAVSRLFCVLYHDASKDYARAGRVVPVLHNAGEGASGHYDGLVAPHMRADAARDEGGSDSLLQRLVSRGRE